MGIIRCATPSPAFLNRQVISLLSSLDVPDAVFHAKLDVVLKHLNKESMHSRLKNRIRDLIKESNSKEIDPELRRNFHQEIDLHFGPSKEFKRTFLDALFYEE